MGNNITAKRGANSAGAGTDQRALVHETLTRTFDSASHAETDSGGEFLMPDPAPAQQIVWAVACISKPGHGACPILILGIHS
jgi:hypothetical protein